jgi:tRNA A-37 threonylcarbamoyl transferase component Bud32
MPEAKNTARSTVRLGYDGRVHKTFRGHLAKERYEHEVRVLQYLEKQGCNFVPRVLETDPETLTMVTSNCGARVEHITEDKLRQLFFELEQYGVRHEDAYLRNVTYRASYGRFCLIDFEFATILAQPDLGPPPPPPDPGRTHM